MTGEVPAFHSLTWTAPHAAGFLLCDGYLCQERGSWRGWPYLLSGRPLREAARDWHSARRKRMAREGTEFFEEGIEPWPGMPETLMAMQTRMAPRKQARKPARKRPGHSRPGK